MLNAHDVDPRRLPPLRLAVGAIGCVLIVAGCAPASAPSRSDGASAAQSAGTPKTIRLGLHASREPTDGIIQFAGGGSGAAEHYLTFHAGLTVYDSVGNPQPRLAQKIPTVDDGDWQVSPDGRMEVTWKIRPEARWHDGAPLTADDYPPQLVTVKNAWEPNGLGTTVAVPRGIRNLHLQRRDPNAPWARDVRVRQALIHLIDRQSMVEVINSGIGGPADTYLTREDPVYGLLTQRGLVTYPYDLARAERLLVDAGLTRGGDGIYMSGGQRFSMEVAATGRGENPQEAEAVSSLWSAGGIASRPVIIPAMQPTWTNGRTR